MYCGRLVAVVCLWNSVHLLTQITPWGICLRMSRIQPHHAVSIANCLQHMNAMGSIPILLWPRTHDLSSSCFVRPPEIVQYCRSSNPCRQYCFFAFVGAYYSLSCEPTLGENQIFHSMVKRQVMKTRDGIKLIGDGKAQKLKKDKVIESWIKVDIDTVRAKKKLLSFLGKTTFQLKEFFCLFLFVFPLFYFFFIYINCVSIMHM